MNNQNQLSFRYIPITLFIFGAFYLISDRCDSFLPPVKTDPGGFRSKNARKYLEGIERFGPRITGSPALENYTVEYLKSVVVDITENSNSNTKIVSEVQSASGCFAIISQGNPMLKCYHGINNFVVRIGQSGKQWSDHSIMLNCHTDSEPNSPGASDDAVSCAVMLEILRVIAYQKTPLRHDVIFLFNGGEETGLQASHGFITKHRWRHSIRAFINLEAGGAGGRELLFQAGPGTPWLMESYLKHAPNPHCSVILQEMFQRGIIPSDTDFRIFRDYGHIPGLDIAFVKNGYLYHTEFDQSQFIADGSIQRAGDNVLGVVFNLANTSTLVSASDIANVQTGAVFFDYLGIVAIQYSAQTAVIINVTVILALLTYMYLNESIKLIPSLISVFITLNSLVISIVTVLVISQVVTVANQTLLWYSAPYRVVLLYVLPGLGVCIATTNVMYSLLSTGVYMSHCTLPISSYMSIVQQDIKAEEQHHSIACMLVVSIPLVVGTQAGVASVYVCTFYLVSALSRCALLHLLACNVKSGGFYLIHMLSFAPFLLYLTYLGLTAISTFVPLFGRTGSNTNSEPLMAFLCYIFYAAIFLSISSVVRLINGVQKLMVPVICLPALLLMISTALKWEPYSFELHQPRLKRLQVQHTERSVYGVDGFLSYHDHGLWIVGMDFRGVKDLPDGFGRHVKKIPACAVENTFCGLPYYKAKKNIFPRQTLWMNTSEKPNYTPGIKLELVEKEEENEAVTYKFRLDGANHMAVHITPTSGCTLINWSFDEDMVDSQNGTFVIHFMRAGQFTWEFTLTFVVDQKPTSVSHRFNLAVSSFHFFGESSTTTQLEEVVENVKNNRNKSDDWRWKSTLQHWTSEYVATYFN